MRTTDQAAAVEITRAGPEASVAIAQLHGEIFTAAWDAETFLSLLEQKGALCFVASQSGQTLTGFILCQTAGGEAEILTLGVARSDRSKGFGRQLVEAAAIDLRQDGASRLILEVADDNLPALALYEAAGFLECARRVKYYVQGRPEPADALVLARAL